MDDIFWLKDSRSDSASGLLVRVPVAAVPAAFRLHADRQLVRLAEAAASTMLRALALVVGHGPRVNVLAGGSAMILAMEQPAHIKVSGALEGEFIIVFLLVTAALSLFYLAPAVSVSAGQRHTLMLHPVSVRTCIRQWNKADLGAGRRLANAVSGFGRKALMTSSKDGACVVSFPGSVGRAAGEGVFLSLMRGDYSLEQNPFETQAADRPLRRATLEKAASRFRNVEFAAHGGRLRRELSPHLPILNATVVGQSSFCDRFTVGTTSEIYSLSSRHTSCVTVRIITWAWSEHRGHRISSSATSVVRGINGWRCVGERSESDPGKPLHLGCRRSDEQFEVVTRIPRPHPLGGN